MNTAVNAMNEITRRSREIVAVVYREQRDLSPEEVAEMEELTQRFDAVAAGADTMAVVRDRLGAVSAGRISAPVQPGYKPGSSAMGSYRTLAHLRYDGAIAGRYFEDLYPVASTQERSAFPDLASMIRAAVRNPMDPRLQVSNAASGQSEGEGTYGGFVVPVQFISSLLNRSLEMEAIRPRAMVLPMSSASAAIPAWESTDHTGAKRHGLSLAWMGEAAQGTVQKAKLRSMNMVASKGAIFCSLTNELLEDNPEGARMLDAALVNATSAGLDYAFVMGTGAGQPLGIVNAPATISQTKESGQTAATIVEQNIVKMAARLEPSSWSRAVWLASPTTLAQLLTLTQATGPNAGGRAALLSERDGTLFLMTRPVVVTDACAVVGTKGDLVLADLSRYLVGVRRDVRIETSIHSGWLTDETGVRLVLRMAGQPEVDAPTKLRDGTNTVSPFVALETRS